MSKDTSFAAIEKHWFTVLDNYGRAMAAANSDQKKKITSLHDEAHDAYNKALNKLFEQTNPEVADLTKKLNSAQTSIDQEFKSLKNISKLIDTLSGAVKLAAALAALAV